MIISHRINYLNELISDKVFSESDGIEFDIRDSSGVIVVQHDPFLDGQSFADFIKYCPPDKFYIVNIKSEGIEFQTLEILQTHNINKFFLLDCSIPMIVKLSKSGEKRIAIRFSEYESVETIRLLKNCASWVWLDVFSKLPITKEIESEIHSLGLNICIVSPELQTHPEKISAYILQLQNDLITIDAVCCKEVHISKWRHSSVLSPCPS